LRQQIEEWLARALAGWVDGARRNASRVVTVTLALTAALLVYSVSFLGVNSDNVRLLSDDVPSKRALDEFAELFPILNDSLLVVIDAETPELARETSEALAARLSERPDLFRDVYLPGGGAFFERNGLLYRQVGELDDFADRMAELQPFIAELQQDASLANLALLVRRGLSDGRFDATQGARWAAILEQVGQASVAVYAEVPVSVSWEELLLRGTSVEVSTRRVLLVDPVLDFDSLLAARRSIRSVREAARDLAADRENRVQVRITGNPALNYEEMLGLVEDIAIAGVFCFLLVAAVLYRALRSVPLVVAALCTLLVGLVWTAAFATAAVGQLNLISVSFAVLFIGLGADFAIHLGMQYGALRRDGVDHAAALREAARGVGSSLVLCTFTTAMGFYAFVPTAYRGVAELGLISGTGMLIILFQTLTFFVALISSWLPVAAPTGPERGLRFDPHRFAALTNHPRAIRRVALVLGAAALLALPSARFDPDVVRMRDPGSESVQAFDDLLAQNDRSSPWFANVVARDLPTAAKLAERLRGVDEVAYTVTLEDYVPADQEQKREILADLALMLDVPKAPSDRSARLGAPEQLAALRDLRDFLATVELADGTTRLGRSVHRLRVQLGGFLSKAEREGDLEPVLASLERSLLGRLPAHLERLQNALEPGSIAIDDLPRDLVRRMVASDGRARLQVFPSESLREPRALERFVDAVHAVAPQATGLAVNLVEFGRATVASLEQALISALAFIALLLWLLWRRLDHVLLVLAPLLLGAALTVASMVGLGIAFNFANIIVIPLILGIGVDSGIHLVKRAREAAADPAALLGSTTARAVFYSALTTVVSFGSLAFSSHRGMESLGLLLVVGMLFTLLCNLVLLPALLAGTRR
jgi:hopanoid biosynthesis associated RND transporter like protein HpnN